MKGMLNGMQLAGAVAWRPRRARTGDLETRMRLRIGAALVAGVGSGQERIESVAHSVADAWRLAARIRLAVRACRSVATGPSAAALAGFGRGT